MKTENVKLVQTSDLDDFVSKTYGRPFMFQQQSGCRDRGTVKVKVPIEGLKDCKDGYVVEDLGYYTAVSMNDWLERDPKEPVSDSDYDWELNNFWERNFYPDIEILFDDLFKKGLIEEGEYIINIDW